MIREVWNRPLLWWLGLGLLSYGIGVTILAGDFGFEGDDWWIFSWPYWHQFPYSLVVYAKESLRPVEGIYWVTMFELFGFNKPVFHLFSQLLLASAALLFGACLNKAFPGRPLLVAVAVPLAFFLPTVSCLTYVVTTDNCRLSLLLFWASVFLFQRWAERGASRRALLVPVAVYLCAFLAYEAPTLLIMAVPFLVWPIHIRNRQSVSDRSMLIRLSVGTLGALGSAVCVRFLFLSGGAVGHRHVLPPTELIWGYPALLPFYLAEPFRFLTEDPSAWALGVGVAVWVCAATLLILRRSGGQTDDSGGFFQSRLYIAGIGLAIFLLGLVPYQLAGYGTIAPTLVDTVKSLWGLIPQGEAAWFNFNWSSRIYSAASFGLALMFAVAVTTIGRKRRQWVLTTLAAIAIGSMAVFHAGLATDWKEAADVRTGLMKSLVSQVPDVKSGTNFVFLNLDCRHKRAVVFRGWMGLRELVRILYDDRRLNAWYLYPCAWQWPNRIFQQALVSPDGFVSRGVRTSKPIPHDSLLIFNRSADGLSLVERLAADDGLVTTGIAWKQESELYSNPERIVAWSEIGTDAHRKANNIWNTGLIATLNLYRLKLEGRVGNRWTYAFREGKISRWVPRHTK